MAESEPLGIEQALQSYSTEEIVKYLRGRLADPSRVTQELVGEITSLAGDAKEALAMSRSVKEKAPSKNWLDRAREESLVVRRYRVDARGPGSGYGNDRDIFPGGEDYRQQLANKYEYLSKYGHLPWHCDTLSRSSVLEARHIRYPEERKYYPVILANDGNLDNEPITIVTLENRDKDDLRESMLQFSLYFPQEFGHDFVDALREGDVSPEIFALLYDGYYPPEERGRHQTILSGDEKIFYLMEGTPDNRTVKNASITPLEVQI